LREHLQNRSSGHIYNASRISPISGESFTHTQLHIYIYIFKYIVCCVCVSVCVRTEPHHAQRLNANTANTQAICKNAFYVGWCVQAGSTQQFALRACLYINRHDSCSSSVPWNVCAAAYEHRVETGGVTFKDAFAFWFAAVPSEQLLTAPALSETCTHISESVLANVVPSHLQLVLAI